MNCRCKNWIIGGILLVLVFALYTFKNYYFVNRVMAVIVAITAFYFFDLFLSFKFKLRHYVIFGFIVISGILFSPLYFLSENYDKILHLTMPFFVAFIVYYVLDTKTRLSLKERLFFTFSVVVMFLAVWEIVEYGMDILWDYKMQGVYLRDITGVEKFNLVMDKNDDTMIDLSLGMLGSLFFVCYKFVSEKIKRH